MNINRLGGHKEWAPTRKIDPTYSMPWMRGRVLDVLNQEDDMAFTDRHAMMLEQLWKALRPGIKGKHHQGWLTRIIRRMAGRNKELFEEWKPGIVGKRFPGPGNAEVARILDEVMEQSARVAGLKEAVKQINNGHVDVEEIEAAAQRGAAAALEAAEVEADPKA